MPGTTTQQIVLGAPAIAGQVLTSGGSASLAATAWGAAAVPVVGAVVAGVTIALALIFARKGPRQKVATTQIVDAVEPKLAENRDGYLNGPRTRSSQAQAIQNFLAGWEYVRQQCGAPEMGEPGRRCIVERDRRGVWDWWALYHDPIARDTPQDDPIIPGLPSVNDLFQYSDTAGVSWLPLAIGSGLIALALFQE